MKSVAKQPLENISPFTLLDYPEHTACILWFAGCNMKCQYCYNPEIVFSEGRLTYDDAIRFLKKRQELLDGVVLSGGECTTKMGFAEFVAEIKELGFKVKIDTNGSAPWVIESLLSDGLLDYVALDFKAPPAKFMSVTQSKLFSRFEQTLKLLISSNIQFEVRTTFHSDVLNQEDVFWMRNYLVEQNYIGTYFLQNALNDVGTIGKVGDNIPFKLSQEFMEVKFDLIIRN